MNKYLQNYKLYFSFILNSLNGYVRPFITKIGHLYKKKY